MSTPYFITGPALISFSGGRTSAFMLHEILRAHGGKLPEDVVVAFENTGKEREETLRFVHDCSVRWNVRVRWLEWRDTEAGYEEVGFNSAARAGEPFDALIAKRGFVPNQGARFCSVTLKTRTARNFAVNGLGWHHWDNIIGLRYDEGHRVLNALARNDTGKDRFKAVMPMSRAKHTKADVLRFWLGENTDPRNLTHPLPQGFDLGLADYEGNCDLCFLKSRGKLKRIIRDNPGAAEWWIAKERETLVTARAANGAEWREGESYADLEREVLTQPYMPGLLDDNDEEYDAECGLHCAAE